MFDHSSVRKGMLVRSSDGEKLGKVVSVSEHSLQVGKGGFFSSEYTALLTDVREIRGEELTLALDRAALRHGDAKERARQAPDARDLGTTPVARDSMQMNGGGAKPGFQVEERTVGVAPGGGALELRETRMALPNDGGWSEERTQLLSVDEDPEERDEGRAPDAPAEPEEGVPLEHP